MESSNVVWWDLRTTRSSGYWERTFTHVRRCFFPLPLLQVHNNVASILGHIVFTGLKNAINLSFLNARMLSWTYNKGVSILKLCLRSSSNAVLTLSLCELRTYIFFNPFVSGISELLLREKCRKAITGTFKVMMLSALRILMGARWDVIGILESIYEFIRLLTPLGSGAPTPASIK